MKLTLVLIAQAGSWVLYPPLSTAQEIEPSAAVKACIAANAPAVERSIEGLSEATDFLVMKVCAGPIDDQRAAEARKASEAYKARLDAMCKTLPPAMPKASTKSDDEEESSVDMQRGMCAIRDMGNTEDYVVGRGIITSGTGTGPPKALSLAAQTLLQLRTDHRGGALKPGKAP